MYYVWIILTCALALAIGYSLYLALYRKAEFHSWVTSLLTTLISVFLGVVTAVLLLRYQDQTATEAKRKQLLSLVSIELQNNLSYLDNRPFTVEVLTNRWPFHSSHLASQAIDSAALSGIFTERQAKDLLTLGGNIRFYNSLIAEIQVIFSIPQYQNQVSYGRNLFENQEGAYSAMAPNIRRCAQDLGLNLKATP
jgi:hypothetical protein